MNTPTNQRGESRVPMSLRGTLIIGDHTFPCMLFDLSEGGMQIMSTRPLAVGQILGFRCEVFPGSTLECKVEVRHTGENGSGMKVVEIDEKGEKLCKLILQEHFSGKLTDRG